MIKNIFKGSRIFLVLLGAIGVFFLTMFHSSALANDGFGALGVGGIVVGKTDDIAIKKEVLEISYKKISVQYEFVNESNKDIVSEVIFPLPPYPASPRHGGIISAGQPLNFIVSVNGQKVKYRMQVRATMNGTDITKDLHALGFTDVKIVTFPFEKTMQENHQLPAYISSQTLIALQQKGYVISTDIPNWEINVTYQWRQTFPAKKSINIAHSYTPFISLGTASGFRGIDSKKFRVDEGRKFVKAFCPSKFQIEQLNRLFFNKKTPNLSVYNELRGTNVDYILTTANTWKDGIRDFILKIRTGAPEEIVCTCFPATLKRVSSDTYVAHLKNFIPTSDLSIYFGNIKELDWSKHSSGLPPKGE